MKVGVYFFSTALNEQEAIEEAKYTCSVIRDYDISYPVVRGEDNDYYLHRTLRARTIFPVLFRGIPQQR